MLTPREICVLLVEDSPTDAELIRAKLREVPATDYRLFGVTSLQEALLALRRESIDVILLDLNLPDSDGVDTFMRLHVAAPEVPVVVVSGTTEESDGLHAVRAGAQDFLVKSHLDGELLSRAVRYALERRRAEDQLRDLQKQLNSLTIREQRRISQDLHDGLGQHLTGCAMMARSLQRRLETQDSLENAAAGELVSLILQAQEQVRALVRGLHPVDVDAKGLMNALNELAASTQQRCEIACTFQCMEPVPVDDNDTATQLFYIAQEAIHNAIRHANAQQLVVRLGSDDQHFRLEISDNGIGLPAENARTPGKGLKIMRYRAELIGATLEVCSSDGGGVTVTCVLRKG